MDKGRLAQLIADYREGKITAEEFNAQRNSMEGKSDTSQNPAHGVLGTMEAVLTILYGLAQVIMFALIFYYLVLCPFFDK